MGQLVGCIEGIGAAVAALDMPIVSGNVSLYNETDGTGILPTPTIGAVGLLASLDDMIPTAPSDGDTLVLLGETRGHLGQSALLAELYQRIEGDAPPVDLTAERAHGELVRAAFAAGLIRAAHDLSDGGLALAASDMALAGDVGITLEGTGTGWWFGEDQARYLLATRDAEALITMARSEGLPAKVVGQVGGGAVVLGSASVALADLRVASDTALPHRFG